MLEEKPEYKKRKKYTKRRQQVIRQLFFTGVAVVVAIIGCATWALKSDNMARKADIQAKTSQTGRKRMQQRHRLRMGCRRTVKL